MGRRRWFVLTPQYLCSFKTQGELRNPTEAFRLSECSTVKSADQDTGKENSFRVDTGARFLAYRRFICGQRGLDRQHRSADGAPHRDERPGGFRGLRHTDQWGKGVIL